MDLKKEIDALTKEKKLEQAHIKLNEFIKTNPTLDSDTYFRVHLHCRTFQLPSSRYKTLIAPVSGAAHARSGLF